MRLILNLLGILVSIATNAQTIDTTRIEISTSKDTIQQSSAQSRYLNNKFWRSHREERTLIKIGFIGVPTNSARYEATAEQKLVPAWSTGVSLLAFHSRTSDLTEAQLGGAFFTRWYYRMDKRIREGRSANNFVDYYLMVRGTFPIYEAYTVLAPNYQVSGYTSVFNPAISLTWGGQLRLGRWGYFDLYTGMGYRSEMTKRLSADQRRLTITLGMMIGLGF